jgi:hypothetical protein
MNIQNLVQDACFDKLNAASLAVYVDVDDSDALPYTVLRVGNVSEGLMMSKTHDGFSCVASMVSWSTSPNTAQANAATGVSALLDRGVTWSIAGFTVSMVRLEFMGDIEEDASRPNDTYWAVPYNVRFEVEEQ